jgi:transcriptional regulator with XRE-family HTH domain
MNFESRQRLASFIKDLRGSLTLSAFGAKIGVSHVAVSNWEAGTSEPSRERLSQIAKLAGYTLDDFVAMIEGKPVSAPEPVSKIKAQIKSMTLKDLTTVYRAVGDRLSEIAEKSPS